MSFLEDYKRGKDIDGSNPLCFQLIVGEFIERDTESALVHIRGGWVTSQAYIF